MALCRSLLDGPSGAASKRHLLRVRDYRAKMVWLRYLEVYDPELPAVRKRFEAGVTGRLPGLFRVCL